MFIFHLNFEKTVAGPFFGSCFDYVIFFYCIKCEITTPNTVEHDTKEPRKVSRIAKKKKKHLTRWGKKRKTKHAHKKIITTPQDRLTESKDGKKKNRAVILFHFHGISSWL